MMSVLDQETGISILIGVTEKGGRRGQISFMMRHGRHMQLIMAIHGMVRKHFLCSMVLRVGLWIPMLPCIMGILKPGWSMMLIIDSRILIHGEWGEVFVGEEEGEVVMRVISKVTIWVSGVQENSPGREAEVSGPAVSLDTIHKVEAGASRKVLTAGIIAAPDPYPVTVLETGAGTDHMMDLCIENHMRCLQTWR